MLPGQPARNLGSSLEAIFYRIYRRRSVVVVIGVCRCNHKWSGARDRLNAAPWSCHDYPCRPRFPARSNRLGTTRRRRESSSGLSAGSVAHRALAMIVGTPEARLTCTLPCRRGRRLIVHLFQMFRDGKDSARIGESNRYPTRQRRSIQSEKRRTRNCEKQSSVCQVAELPATSYSRGWSAS
jgi:hypothetical protein